MARIEFKHPANWRNHEFIFVREVQVVQTVDELRAVRHGNFLGMPVENIERHTAEHGVPQRGDLFQQVAGSGFASRTIPRTPFVHDQLDAMVTVKFA